MGDPSRRAQPLNPALSQLILMGLLWGCSLLPAPHPTRVWNPLSPPLALWGHGDTARDGPQALETPPWNSRWDGLLIPSGIYSPVVPGSRAGLGNPTERQELSRTPQPHPEVPESPVPFGDTHLVPLLSSASREPSLTPGTLRRDGRRGWEPPTAPTATPEPPGWAPTAGPTGPGSPSAPGGPWKDGNGLRWMRPGGCQPWCPRRGAPGGAPGPAAPGVGSRGTHQLPFLAGGTRVASLAFDALGEEGDEVGFEAWRGFGTQVGFGSWVGFGAWMGYGAWKGRGAGMGFGAWRGFGAQLGHETDGAQR